MVELTWKGLNDNIPQNYDYKTTYSAFMGIMHISDMTFLLVADKVKPTCKIENNDVFFISSVTFVPFEVKTEEKKIC